MKTVIVVVLALSLFSLFSCINPGEDLSFQNPEWRNTVDRTVAFPLPEQITLRVGLNSSPPDENSQTVKWIEEYTNIDLVFVALGSSPGDVSLGETMRRGELPDIMPEGRLPLTDDSIRELFVDFLEFAELTPNFRRLLDREPYFKASILARTTPSDQLYSLGSYDPDRFVADGVVAFRRDIFEKHNLKYGTWPEVIESLRFLKGEYPESYPLGGTFTDLLNHFPGWWGSGIDQEHIAYFDPETRKWKMGLFEEQFLESIRLLGDLAGEGLLSPDTFVMKDDGVRAMFSNDLTFFAPYYRLTGPSFGYTGEGYGALGDDGEWNGEGKWIEAMPLPRGADGESIRYSSRFLDPAGKGWQVYSQSAHVGEAIALLDLLFTDEAALVHALGAPGGAWDLADGEIVLKETFLKAYKENWVEGLGAELSAAGIVTGSPLVGLEIDFPELFGLPDVERLRYYINHDMQQNRPGIDVLYQPGVRFPEDEDFRADRAMIVVTLQTEIESKIAQYVSGQAEFSKVTDMLERMRTYGEDLLEMYNSLCIVPDEAILSGKSTTPQ